MKTYIEELKPLLADASFSFTLLRLCPLKEFPMLCEFVPLDQFIDCLSRNIKPNYKNVSLFL